MRSCGLARYLGESEELACVQRFADAQGEEHELRLSPILDLDPAAAARLHASSGSPQLLEADPSRDPRGSPSAVHWLASTPSRSWAMVSGWPALRRLSWTHAACSPEAMLPVLEAMAAAPPQALTPLPRLEFGARASERSGASLLTRDAGQPPGAHEGPFALPYGASELGRALLRAAAAREGEAFAALFEADARWGLPDRRQLSGRSLHADPEAALHALARAAARLPEDTRLHCPELDRRVRPAVARGELSMWCVWLGPDQLDLIALSLRGRVVEGHADAKLTYLGVFPDAPLAPVALPAEPPPPPVTPRPDIACGDPHALAFPGLCPVEEFVEDDAEGELETAGEAGELPAAEREGEPAPPPNPAAGPARRGEVLRLPLESSPP